MEFAIIAGVFFVIIIAVSLLTRKFAQSGEDFFVGGRRVPWWGIGPTLAAGLFGGTSILVVAGNAMESGLSSLWILAIPSWIGAFLGTIFLAKKVRAVVGAVSLPDFIGLRFGEVARAIFMVVTLLFYVAWTTSQLLALSIFLSVFTGVSLLLAMLIIIVIAIALAAISGFMGVIVSDGIMAVLMVVGLGVMAISGFNLAGGVNNVFDVANSQPGYLNLFSEEITPGVAFVYVLVFGVALIPQQDILQRFGSAKSTGHAVGGGMFAVAIMLLLYIFPLLIGFAGNVWVPEHHEGTLPADDFISWTATNMYGPWMSSFFFIVIFASILSTLSTTINSGALTITKDIFVRYINSSASNKTILAISRIATVIMGLIAVLIATTFDVILDALLVAFSVQLSGILVPVLACFYFPRANQLGVSMSALGGTGFIVIDYILSQMNVNTPWPGEPYSVLIGFTISILGLIIGTYSGKPPTDSAVRTTNPSFKTQTEQLTDSPTYDQRPSGPR